MSAADTLPEPAGPHIYASPGKQDCLSCRIIGAGTLGAVGIYALNQSRARAPGSLVGKRIMAGVGLCTCLQFVMGAMDANSCAGFLAGSALRWSR
jgi:hypothetical protein